MSVHFIKMPTLQPEEAPGRGELDWMQTFTGRQFWPADPNPFDIDIRDIAHALAYTCRFGGHVRQFYSVAEHSIQVSLAAPPSMEKWALLHDASEAYLVDVPRPVKRNLTGYAGLEDRLMKAVAERFDLTWPMPALVKDFDNRILLDERQAFMGTPPASWGDHLEGMEPLGCRLLGLLPAQAERWFLDTWEEIR